MDDNTIVALFWARSERAIHELSQKHGSACVRVAKNILGDRRDVEECVNDAYLGAWNSIPPQRPDPLRTYVCRITRNLALKRYHANTAAKRGSGYDEVLDELENCLPSPGGVEEELEARELSGLDREERIMFVLRYWYADPVADIARRFHVSSHFVSVRLSRTRDKLRRYLVKKGVPL